ncbi:MAG: DMT family transporter [Proteobacteria bacterium]|nr:DMT family transporter [Pseudomonadota bacterium]
MQHASPIAPAVTHWRGVIMALAVGVSFASNTSLAALAYRGGATPLAVLLARSITAFVLLYALLAMRGIPRRLPPARRRGAVLIGCVFASYSFGVLQAIQWLPVGLVVATFYSFPILVGLIEWWSGRQAFSARTATALVIAFCGILLALDVFGARLHRLGIALVLAGAVGVTVVMTMSARVRGGGDSRPVTLHMLATAITIFALIAIVHGGVQLPHTPLAWAAFIGAPLFYSFGIITLFVVVAELGPVKTSLIMNIEPVTSVVLGYLLLDQRLGHSQLLGIGLVVAAVLLIESAKLKGAMARR